MEYIIWHYTKGLDYYINRWINLVGYINHYFSLGLLLKTLFSPWKRLVEVDKTPGFNISKFFESMMFNLISRGIGAVVRIALFFAGLLFITFTFFGGAIFLVVWLIIPILSLPTYLKIQRSPENILEDLFYKIKKSTDDPIKLVLESTPGLFFVDHLGIDARVLQENAKVDKDTFSGISAKTFQSLVDKLIKKGVWGDEFLRKNELTGQDLILTAKWWDKMQTDLSKLYPDNYLGSPGMGLELLFGYTPTLNNYSVDLSAPQSFSHRLIGREDVVQRMERALTSGNSVVLIGQPGVGKKTVVLEFAHRAHSGQLGAEMAFRRVLEFDYNFLLSESTDLNQKKTKLAQILAEASYAGNIILMIRDIQRLTNSEIEGYDFTDVFEEYMEKKELKIIAVSTPKEYERFISPNLRLRKFLKEVEVTPPTMEEAMEIIIESAKNWEAKKRITVTMPALRKILEESDRYITEAPFPEKALELLDSLVFYIEQKGVGTAKIDDANAVLAEKTGVSFTHITGEAKKRLGNLEDIIHQRLINQDAAVSLIAKSLRGRTVGVKKGDRPVGSFMFLGPTGVGKTETAKVLAREYYGSEDEIIRFDMAEYSGMEGLERLIGSMSKNQPGNLTTAIKNRPASLLLLDEIEKATPEIYNLFLTLLDEGSLSDAFGRKINARHLFVIATSNAGAEYIRKLVTSVESETQLQKKVVEHILQERIFSPEFLNRFDGVVVFEPLKDEHLVKIAHLMLNDLAENLKSKNIYLEVTDDAARKIAKDGYEPAFGARPMRRIIDLVLGDLIGKAVLKDEIQPGDKIKIIPGPSKEEFRLEKLQ